MPRKAASGKSATTFGTSKTSFSRSISGRTESPTQNGIIQLTVDRVKAGLTAFAGDIRTNGKDLVKAEERLHGLERLSNSMLDKLASWGAEIDDTPFILRAQDAATTISKAIENGIEGNLVTMPMCSTGITGSSAAPIPNNMTAASATSPMPMSGRSSTASS